MTQELLPTTVVGSYPQPDWLVDRALLQSTVPRVRLHELWRIPEPYLAQAQDDATLLAIRDMERAGIDIITDGEMRRESYSNRFATALDGIDNETPATITNRAGRSVKVPRVVGKLRRRGPVEVADMAFLRRNTERKAKITLTINVQGLKISLDGQPTATPTTIIGIVGIERTLEAPLIQVLEGKRYNFLDWSDGGGRAHTISTPAHDMTYTARYNLLKTSA